MFYLGYSDKNSFPYYMIEVIKDEISWLYVVLHVVSKINNLMMNEGIECGEIT
jgi:hypothetical protein